MYKNVLEIDVIRCVMAIFKRWKFIALIAVLSFVVGWALTLDVGVDQYTATATVYAAADNSYTDATNAVTAMNAYLDVAKSYKVSQRAALLMGRSDVDASYLQNAVWVSSSAKKTVSTSTNFLYNSATIMTFGASSPDPELSMEMADAMAESYTIEMSNILKTDAVKTLDNAHDAYRSVNARKEAWKTRLLYMLIGFFASIVLVIACEIFDRKVRTVREATIRNELPIIGIIPDYKD
jgi:capsular polysaccharide biosynthesis protein